MAKALPHNRLDKPTLQRLVDLECFERTTISFYRYVPFTDLANWRDKLYKQWDALRVLGRVYLSTEGINAQISVPTSNVGYLRQALDEYEELRDVPFKIAVEEPETSFLKLTLKVKEYIVADGLPHAEYDLSQIGEHITAAEMNDLIADPESIVIDMRNNYEYEIGRFEKAVCPNTDTFREALPKAVEMAKGYEQKPVVLYCTGGIRCEKASAYFRHHGFEQVSQLHGGIIDYDRQVKAADGDLPCRYRGKNFVFDGRRAEAISDEVLSVCHQCDAPCDTHVNCANKACNCLYLQCEVCRRQYGPYCQPECRAFTKLPEAEQLERIRAGEFKTESGIKVACKIS